MGRNSLSPATITAIRAMWVDGIPLKVIMYQTGAASDTIRKHTADLPGRDTGRKRKERQS